MWGRAGERGGGPKAEEEREKVAEVTTSPLLMLLMGNAGCME